MFDFVVRNILNRYTLKELSEIYGVDLPDYNSIAGSIQSSHSESIKGKYYEIINSNKFIKDNGHKVMINIFKNEQVIALSAKLSFIDKIKLWLSNMIKGMVSKVQNLINSILDSVPQVIKIPLAIIMTVTAMTIILPFALLGVVIRSIAIVRSAPGNILIGLIMASISLVFGLFITAVSLLIAPIMNAFADKLVSKSLIKKLIIGEIEQNNIINGNLYISLPMVNDIDLQSKKSMVGKNNYFITLKNSITTESEVTFSDKILGAVLTNYYINKKTVFIVNENDKKIFENLLVDKDIPTSENKISSLLKEEESAIA